MSRVNVIGISEGAMYPVRDILETFKGKSMRDKAIFVSKEVYDRILENMLKPEGSGKICKYGDLYIPTGYSITLARVNHLEDVFSIYWLTYNNEYVYNQQTLPEKYEIYYFTLKGEDTRKKVEALSQMRP